MRMPLNTREGKADEPIEPVIWNIEPCEAAPPANLWRFTTPANPRPLLVRNHVHKLLAVENVDQHLVANLGAVLAVAVDHDRHLAQEAHRRQVVLGEVSLHRLGQPRLLHELHQPDLGGIVAVLGDRLALGHDAGASLQHRDRVNITLVIEELRHADFLAENSVDCHFLSSTPLPVPELLAPGACAAEALFCQLLAVSSSAFANVGSSAFG